MKKNIKHLKTNWLINFSYFETHSPRFPEVKKLVDADKFEDALRLMDNIKYTYSNSPQYQTLRNLLIQMCNKEVDK